MDFTWISITYYETLWVGLVFILGLLARHFGMPPLIGYLIAGFILKSTGVEFDEGLSAIADLGITLLLFTIGLKLDVRSLVRREIWAVSSIHVLISIVLFGSSFHAISLLGFHLFADFNWSTSALVAFALSFSSTVFAVKLLEERGEMTSNHGRIAIGILIMQDIFAVVFLTVSTGKLPSPWAFAVLAGLWFARPLFDQVMNRVGYGELFAVYGFILALGGAAIFEAVSMKADLGALIMGMMLARHARAGELSRELLGFKDIFLIGFFLSIGLNATISVEALLMALLILPVVPVKIAMFYWLLTRFYLRARTAFFTSISLGNYSEFGLIVGAVGFGNGWLSSEWLGVIAIAMAITFILAAPINTRVSQLYARFGNWLKKFERAGSEEIDKYIDTGDAQVLIFGMGRVGTAAYDKMRSVYGNVVLGLDIDEAVVKDHQEKGRHVILGDATDHEFWEVLKPGKVRVVLLDMPNHTENMFAAQQLAKSGFKGRVAATAKYDDQVTELTAAGLDAAYNIYSQAGFGFADHVSNQFCDDVLKNDEDKHNG